MKRVGLVALLLLAACSGTPDKSVAAASPGAGPSFGPGAGGGGPLLPDVRQRRLRRGRLRPRPALRPGDRQLDRHGRRSPRPPPQDLSRFNLDLAGLTAAQVTVDGAPATGASRRQRADDHAGRRHRRRARVHRGRRLRRQARPSTNKTLGDGGWLRTDDGGGRARPAGVGQHLVPGQRPPVRQGHLHAGDDRAGRAAGDQQRRARPATSTGRLDHLALGRGVADGELPGHRGDREVPGHHRHPRRQADGHRDPGLAARRRPGGAVAGPTGEVADFLATSFGPYPFDAYGGIVVGDRPDPVRAGDPVAADLRRRVLRRRGEHRRDRARAGPPVVRRQRVARAAGRTSGSTRASPPTPSGCGPSTQRRRQRPARLRPDLRELRLESTPPATRAGPACSATASTSAAA